MAEKDYRSKQLLDWFVLEQNGRRRQTPIPCCRR